MCFSCGFAIFLGSSSIQEEGSALHLHVCGTIPGWCVISRAVFECDYWNKLDFHNNKQAQMELHMPDMACSAYSMDVFHWASCLFVFLLQAVERCVPHAQPQEGRADIQVPSSLVVC